MADTESLRFTVDAKGFLASLGKMERALESLGNKAATSASQLNGAFDQIEKSANKLRTAISQAGRGVGDVAKDYGKLSTALRGINRELDIEKVSDLGDAFVFLNSTLRESGSLQRFADKMGKLQGVLKVIKRDAREAAKSIQILAQAADKNLGAVKQKAQTPAQAERDQVRLETERIRLARERARQEEDAARRLAKANRQAAASTREVATESRRASRQSVNAFKRIEGSVASLRIRLLNLRTAFAFLGGGFLVKKVLGFAGDFEQKLAEVGTIISDQSEVQLPQYKEQLLGLAQQGPQDLLDLTESLYQVVSAGIPTIEGAGGAYDVLAQSQRAAVAGVSSLKQATDAVLTAMRGFRSENLSAAEASDKLFKTVELGRTRFELLARSVGRVAAVADEFGADSNELLGGLAAITRVIPSTNEAVTQLRALITGIVRPTVRASEALTVLTDGRADLADLLSARGLQTRGLVGTLRELRDVTGGSATAIAALFPNVRALAASAILGGRNFDQFASLVEGIGASAGATDRAFEKLQFTFNNVAAVFRNKVGTVLIRIGDRILPKLVQLFERLGEFLLKNQDKIVAFFTTLANIFIGLLEKAQKFINEILGAGVGIIVKKVLGAIGDLIGDAKLAIVGGASEAGAEARSAFLSGLGTVGAGLAGAAVGEALFGLKPNVDRELAAKEAQPLVTKDLAERAGFASASAFQEAFRGALNGNALLADVATDINSSDFQAIQKALDLKNSIEGFTTLEGALAKAEPLLREVGASFDTVSEQIDSALQIVEQALLRGDTDYAEGFIADEIFRLEASAERLSERAPALAAALREAAKVAPENIDGFAAALQKVREEAQKVNGGLLRLKSQAAEFAQFLPGQQFGDVAGAFSFDPLRVTDENDPAFDVLRRRQQEQLDFQVEAVKKFASDIAELDVLEATGAGLESTRAKVLQLEEKISAERLNQQKFIEFGQTELARAAGQQAASLEQELAKRREQLRLIELGTEGLREQAAAQEAASRRIVEGIDAFIKKTVDAAKEAQAQEEVEKKLGSIRKNQQRLRSSEIRDNGLLLRLRRRIRDALIDIVRLEAEQSRFAAEREVAAAKSAETMARTLGNVKAQDKAARRVLDAEIALAQLQREKVLEALAGVNALREQNKVADERVDLERTVAGLKQKARAADLDAQNAAARGQEQAQKAAKSVAAAYRATAKEVTELLGSEFDAAMQSRLDAVLRGLGQRLLAEQKAALERIQQLTAAAAVRPRAVAEFEAAVARAKVAALDASQGVETVLRGVVNTARELRATEQQIALGRREATVTGQLGQEFGNALDLAQFKAAREALQEEVQQVAIDLLVNIAQLRKRAAAEQKALQAELAVVTGQRERVDPLLKALGLSDADRLDQRIKELRLQIDNLKASTEANVKQLDAEAEARLAELQLSEQQLQAVKNLIAAEQALAEQTFAAVDSLTFGGASAARFGAAVVDAFSGDTEAAVLGLTAVFETLTTVLDSVVQKVRTFLPDFGRLIDGVFDSLLQGANSVIDGLSTAFTGVFDILFGGFRDAIQSILGFDFFGNEQEQQQRQTIPSVDLRGRFFDQRPEDRARVLAEIRAQGAARDALAAGGEGGQENLSAADLARQTLERAIETAVRATEVIVQILPELLETFLSRVIELLPTLAGKLAQAVAAGIRILADKFDEILVATLDAIGEALPVILEAVGEAIPVIVAQLVAKLPRIVYETLKGLGLQAGGFFTGLGRGIASLFHTGGTVRHGQRNPRAAAMMQALGAQGFANGGTVTLGGLTQQMIGRRLQKDEVPAVLQVGERVVSREELARMGGEAALNRLIENGGLGGGDSYDGVISGISPQAQAAMAAAMAQALRATMGQNVAYNPNAGARVGRGRSF